MRTKCSTWRLVVFLIATVGCSKTEPTVEMVLWKDSAGAFWQAPLRTPSPDDPVWTEHPGAGVVMRCAKTGQETLVSDPDQWLAYRGRPNSPFRSKAGAPLVLPSASAPVTAR